MDFEKQNKNIFYDDKTGFWFIDFLGYEQDKIYDENNPISIFETLNYIIPNPLQFASRIDYNKQFSHENKKIKEFLEYSIQAKFILAIKSVIPNFTKYEKFYLFKKENQFKQYLMSEKITDKNLLILDHEDFIIFDELIDAINKQLIYKIINHNLDYKNVVLNEIRNYSNLFNLIDIWRLHPNNHIKRTNYKDLDDFEYYERLAYNQYFLERMNTKLKNISNDNVINFLNDMNSNNNKNNGL